MADDDESRCDDLPWGFLATSVADAPACVADCREKFLTALSPKDETIESVCELLLDRDGDTDQPFNLLYCCDAQLCGVDNLESGGDDPNVNWVINTCSNLGYSDVRDPGPPTERSYNCDLTSLFGGRDPRCRQQGPGTSQITSISEKSFTVPTMTSLSMATSTQSSISEPSLEASVDPDRTDEEESEGSGMSTGVKVTIGLSALAAVLLLALAVFFIIRNRKKPPHRRKTFGRFLKRDGSPAQADSPTPLVSPTISHTVTGPDGVPLTPPPPLKERKMLDVGASSRPSSAGHPRAARLGFPASPVFAPTMNKLIPRSEGPPISNPGRAGSPPTSPLGWVTNAAAEGSLRSLSSNPTTTASLISAAATNSSERVVSAPARPQRPPPGASLDLPSPGPPPKRALPTTPPNGQVTQPSTPGSARHGDIGVAIGVVEHNPADGVVLAKPSQDLCDLTEQYGRESRNSWGSWRGGGGGGPGAAMSPPKKRDVHSPVMEESDLERLGGRY